MKQAAVLSLALASLVAAQGKVGLGWAYNNITALGNFKTAKVSAVYTWSPSKPTTADSLGLEFIPMLWGTSQINDFVNLVKPGYAKKVLGFNEPDKNGLTPQQAAQLWLQYIQPLQGQGYTLISPAGSSGSGGKAWLTQFVQVCQGCHFDGIALHWYGTASQDFINTMSDFHNTFGLPVWPTEFGCEDFNGGAQCTQAQASSLMKNATTFMDNTSWVAKYFAFGLVNSGGVNFVNQLIDSSGQPTALGKQYIGA